jgi:hypothetical protein
MRRRLIALDGLDRLAARDTIRAWGYPRELHEQELVAARFFSYGPDVIFWLALDGKAPPDSMALHVVTHPSFVLHAQQFREWHATVLAVADLMGLAGVYAAPYPGPGMVLERLGWTPIEGGWYLSLRGED